MEKETILLEEITKKSNDIPEDSGTEEDMAPQGSDTVLSHAQNGALDKHRFSGSFKAGRPSKFSEAIVPTFADEGEDGEILEDGEIASDEGEAADAGEGDSKSSPSKKGHKEERDRHRNKRDRHSKRRRSKEDGHRDKQLKKKRHREYVDYDKAGDDPDQPWSQNERREKGERKGDRSPPEPYHSPSNDSHSEERKKHDRDGDKHRRGSGDTRHHSSGRDRERMRDKDRNRDSRDRSRDRHDKDKKDKHERSDKDKKDREQHKDSRERDFGRQYQHSDEYESPPGIYDSPSDEEYSDSRFGNQKLNTLVSTVEGDYMDPTMAASENELMPPKNKKKMQKKKEWQERARQRERDREFDDEQPVKKKPLLQTPMEERPVCKFFKEGKCQKVFDF